MDDNKIAFQGELMLAGWSETSNGGAKVTFILPDPSELEPFKRMTLAKKGQAGQRFAAVLVEIGDDERPVEQPKSQLWSQKAALLCKDPSFWHFINERMFVSIASENQCRSWMLDETGLMTRRDFDHDSDAQLWLGHLINDYEKHSALVRSVL